MSIRELLAQPGSQREIKAMTRNQVMATLTAATFILVTTISPVASGRTARNALRERPWDQKSGLENDMPTAAARINGIATTSARVDRVAFGSFLDNHEIGP